MLYKSYQIFYPFASVYLISPLKSIILFFDVASQISATQQGFNVRYIYIGRVKYEDTCTHICIQNL